jgi:hypothetical protein
LQQALPCALFGRVSALTKALYLPPIGPQAFVDNL